jgi:hypothetical protein
MVRTDKGIPERRHVAGDAAVDGLLAGTGAGMAMAATLVAGGLLAGEGPAAVLARFDPSGTASPLTGTLMHLAVSAVYGLLFGVLLRLIARGRPVRRRIAVLAGLVFGLVLLLLAQALLATPSGAALRMIPASHFTIAHLIYGGVLGGLAGRS